MWETQPLVSGAPFPACAVPFGIQLSRYLAISLALSLSLSFSFFLFHSFAVFFIPHLPGEGCWILSELADLLPPPSPPAPSPPRQSSSPASECSVHRWTSVARLRAQCAPLDLSRQAPSAVCTAGLQPPNRMAKSMPKCMSEYLPDRMPEYMSEYVR